MCTSGNFETIVGLDYQEEIGPVVVKDLPLDPSVEQRGKFKTFCYKSSKSNKHSPSAGTSRAKAAPPFGHYTPQCV